MSKMREGEREREEKGRKKKRRKVGTKKLLQSQVAFQLLLYPSQAPIPASYPVSSRLFSLLSNGQLLATSFHFTFLPPLKVSYSIHFNIPGKLKTHLQILAFHMHLKAFVIVGMRICPLIVSHFVWLAMVKGLPAVMPAYILIPK